MTFNKNDYKRHFPRIGKCFLCCCCDSEMAVNAGAVLLLVYIGIMLVFNYGYLPINENTNNLFINIMNYVDEAVNIIACISLLLLLIGIKKVKNLFMNQFKIVFLLYWICEIVLYSIVIKFYFSEEYINSQIEIKKQQYKNENFNTYDNNKIKTHVMKTTYISLFILFVLYMLMLYYYLTTCSFIEDLQEQTIADEFRELEEN
ncbi:hypothetical protein BCR32DRAFT_297771 [Anaeromyces robustus]|uniref:Uncharacterized protein n=1 Tax=Anaeromyces robustus TaxID=1754192 RepID=A0A1Y1VVK0_9FUNG|nr:hypothetical protein BCR32DRAFT_297771 [Anaeromyces robustus]|eukprot:ORX65300.1 hypothetical protein BCR32DRAFT_297771 [Anaeromyces robustus]